MRRSNWSWRLWARYVHKPWVVLGNQVARAQQTSMLNVYLEAQFRLLPYFKWQRQVGEERQIGWKSYRLFEVVLNLSTIPCHWALPMCSVDNRLSYPRVVGSQGRGESRRSGITFFLFPLISREMIALHFKSAIWWDHICRDWLTLGPMYHLEYLGQMRLKI